MKHEADAARLPSFLIDLTQVNGFIRQHATTKDQEPAACIVMLKLVEVERSIFKHEFSDFPIVSEHLDDFVFLLIVDG